MDSQPAQTNPASTTPPAAQPAASPPPSQTPVNPAPPSTPPPPANAKSKGFLPMIALVILFIGLGFLALWYFQSGKAAKPEATASSVTPTVDLLPPTLLIGIDPTYPPMEYLEGNNMVGYDIDLANFIGKELGVQMKFKNVVFDDLFTTLENKDIDMIISTITVTEERKKLYDFSEPYLQGGQVILTKKDNTTIASPADLQGKKVGVQNGTTMETEAIKYTADKLVIRYPDSVQATAALNKGEVDAIFADLPGAKGITNANPTLKIASDPFNKEYYAIVFRKGDPVKKDIDKALASLEVKGILADLRQEWLDP